MEKIIKVLRKLSNEIVEKYKIAEKINKEQIHYTISPKNTEHDFCCLKFHTCYYSTDECSMMRMTLSVDDSICG